MPKVEETLQCYNRGCGLKYDPNINTETSCQYHPGEPFFHDAYKGWSCCNKKCTDFTEFLNIKGCTVSFHSNIKPPELKKQEVDQKIIEELVESSKPVPKPVAVQTLVRPPFDSPLVSIATEIAPALERQDFISAAKISASDEGHVVVGTLCKNGGCGTSYAGPGTEETSCIHHPGYPVFHEGLKFWSCCCKRTSDFDAFLNQVGCETGKHMWKKETSDLSSITCRWDWHQTPSYVVVSIYAKQYCPRLSSIRLNPIRLCANLVFPLQCNANFNLDIELRGVVDVSASKASMFGTKVEIKLRKAEAGSWVKLDFPREKLNVENKKSETVVEDLTPHVDAVDLSDL